MVHLIMVSSRFVKSRDDNFSYTYLLHFDEADMIRKINLPKLKMFR